MSLTLVKVNVTYIDQLTWKKIEPSATAPLFTHGVLLQLASIKLTPETLQPVWKGVALLLTNQPHANCALLGSPGTKCVKVCTCSIQAVWKGVALMQPRVSTCVLNALYLLDVRNVVSFFTSSQWLESDHKLNCVPSKPSVVYVCKAVPTVCHAWDRFE